MSTKIFQSNETLEMCDVKVSDNGRIEVITKNYHREEMERLGKPAKTVRGRVKMEDTALVFEPYAENSRKPTYSKQAHVGSCTTLAVTADKLKLSMVMPRHMGKARTIDFIRAEMDDILAQLEGELYESLVADHKDIEKEGGDTLPV